MCAKFLTKMQVHFVSAVVRLYEQQDVDTDCEQGKVSNTASLAKPMKLVTGASVGQLVDDQ